MNELKIYWSVFPGEPMGKNQKPPRKVTSQEWEGEGFTFCPSYNGYLKNVWDSINH